MDDSIFDMSDAGSDFGATTVCFLNIVGSARTVLMNFQKPKKPAKATATKAAPKKAAAPKAKAAPKSKASVPKKRTKAEVEDDNPETDPDNVFDDESLLKDTPPKAKKAKVAPNPVKTSHKKPLAELVNEEMGLDDALSSPKVAKKKRVSEQYQKLTQLEHIIKRPDTYIGSIERDTRQMWVYNTVTDGMEFREVSFVPGLFKIFDEILVNAADNKQNDKNMDEIRVTIDREKGEVSVWNNGRGIPIEIHSKEGIYIPEMIFGHLLAGSNFDDNQQKVTGGRNGYGAKLCNIFSTEFTVETADARQKKKYKQTWTKNMSNMGKAKITDAKGDDFTKITFSPDFPKFGMDGFDDDLEALFKRRVYDLAGTAKGVAVKLNGSRIPARNFKKYIELYTKAIKQERGEEAARDASEIITESPDPRWEVGFAVSDGSFQQVSFVNSIATTVGGTHVNYIADQITNKLANIVKKKNPKGAALKLNQVRNHIFIFVNALIVNPAFSSQTKEQLTTKPSQFGSKCEISDDFIKKIVAKTDIITNILSFAQLKADQILKKSDGNRRSRMHNPKLTDANKAGTKDGYKCTLILTEGDSAKGMAMAGRSVVGPDLFGVFPLRGKMLNVRDASIDQISKNQEIQNIKNFLGLQHKKVYTDTKSLRYGHLMVMTDQDHDGSHIKGLLINFLQVQFPSLLKIEGFLVEFITPIVKAWKGDPKNPSQSRAFYTMPEWMAWKEIHGHDRAWEHKYYKGLGTSTTEESQQYFNDLDKHHKDFEVMKDEEQELIELAFSKKKADERKEWLRQFKPGTFLDHRTKSVSYTDFINKELILFSMADNIRSIPSVIDGLKPGQRKVLYTCFKRNIKKDIKVVELAGMISGLTAYQHGDVSLQQTIVGLAQTFVGSNNINTLEPSGNFGTRLQGGSDAASARYIHTRLSPFARRLFHAADDPLLSHHIEDGKPIEPEIYVPVVPLLLINGTDGIGTGWSSSIPNYNPEDVVSNLLRKMDGEEFQPMQPWFRGFKGAVSEAGPDRFKFSGIAKQTGDNEIEISELPVRVWTQDFKERLEDILKAEKTPSFIKDYKDYNTHKDVHFIIQMDDKHMKAALEEGIEERFKLSKTLATSNLVAFDPEGRITKYASVEAILEEFYAYRLKHYQLRKDWMLKDMERNLKRFTNQARFVQMIIDGKLNISKKKKAVLIAELKKLNFDAFPKVSDAKKAGESEEAMGDEEADDESAPDASSFDYLLGMPLWSLTQERVEKLKRQIGEKEAEIDELVKLSNKDLWRKDIKEFIEEWRFQLDDEHKRERNIRKGRRTSKKFATSTATYKKRKGLGDGSDESDFEAPKAKKVVPSKAKASQPSKAPFVKKSNALESALKAQQNFNHDGASDDLEMPSDTPAASASSKEPKINGIKKESQDDVEDVKPAKPSRAAAKKVAKYALSSDDDSDNGDDLLGDIGSMVKGLGRDSEPARPMFPTSSSRPSSSHAVSKPSKTSAKVVSDDESELVTGAPDAVVEKDIMDISDDEPVSKPVIKKVNGTAAKKVTAPKPKAAAKPAAKKAAIPKKTEQSPAAKAYAKRKAAKKVEESDDDIDGMADDILDSPEASDDDGSSPVKPAARPARRAATTSKKKTYAFDDDDDEEDDMGFNEESTAAFSDSE